MKYNFVVPSFVINNTRSTINDTDYASLGVVSLAPDGTTVGTYGPITQSLGDLDEGPVTLNMVLTDIDVPDGGSMGVVFTMMNKGWWSGKGTIEDALNTVCAGIIGALAGGQIAGFKTEATSGTPATTTTPAIPPTPPAAIAMPIWVAALAVIGVVAIMEGVKLLLVDCDGWVVNATMQIGRVELDQAASQAVWQWSTRYPGSDSPEGCGSNSNYTVNYEIAASSLEVEVPDLTGQRPKDALALLRNSGLIGAIGEEFKGLVDEPQVAGQNPSPGTLVLHSTTVTLNVEIPKGGPLP